MLDGNKVDKFKAFRELMESDKTTYLMEAHSGISAKIVEEAGFDAIWASSLAISSAAGVRDRNEISWTQVLDTAEYMADVTSIPILLDGDTGYGDFNNFARVVKKLCQHDIAAVCIEDKLFPKVNSFLGNRQTLAPVEDFTSKIKAGQDSKTNENFCIVARTEALISGHGVDEAVRRATAYYEAGADAILIHSKSKDGRDILEVMKKLDVVPCPIIIVPTTYYAVPTAKFIEAGVSAVIWANHCIRASVTAMRNILAEISEQKGLSTVESKIEPLSGLFELSGEYTFANLEKKYISSSTKRSRAVILELPRTRTVDSPKSPDCMTEIKGMPVIEYALNSLADREISKVTVISECKSSSFARYAVDVVTSEQCSQTDELNRLHLGLGSVRESQEIIISYGHLFLSDFVYDSLLNDKREGVTIAVDPEPRENGEYNYVTCNKRYSRSPLENTDVYLESIHDERIADGDGIRIGITKVSEKYFAIFVESLAQLLKLNTPTPVRFSTLLKHLKGKSVPINVVYARDGWFDISTTTDLKANAHNSVTGNGRGLPRKQTLDQQSNMRSP